MGVGERENVTDLGGWHALHIAQDDDCTLCGGQCFDRLKDDLARLSDKEFVLRRARERARLTTMPRTQVRKVEGRS
jgi:hypothetical protein